MKRTHSSVGSPTLRLIIVAVLLSGAVGEVVPKNVDSRLMDACMAGEAAEVKELLAEGTRSNHYH